jgi:hypothetical protein
MEGETMKSISRLVLLAAIWPIICVAQQNFPVKVSIGTPTPMVKSGADIKINVAVTNISDHNVRLIRSPDGHAEAINQIEIYTAEGNKLPRLHGTQTWLSLKKTLLKPGAVLNAYLILTQLFDLSEPGKYTVVIRHEMHLDTTGPKPTRIFVPSNTLTITVTQ